MNNEEHVYIKIYLSFYSRKGHTVCCKFERERERWRDIYIERGLLLAPYLLPGTRGCQHLHPLASHIARDVLTPLIGCVSLDRLPILWTLSKSDHVVLISCGLLPVAHLLDRPVPTHCHPPVYKSQRDSLSKHTGSLGTNRKSMLYYISREPEKWYRSGVHV